MEPPGAGPAGRRARPLNASAWRLPAAVGAGAVLLTSAGNGFVAALLLGVAAGPVVGISAALAVAATVARWGTADLSAVAGDQDVLGAALTVSPVLGALSSGLAAAALLLSAARRRIDVAAVVACGIGAAALVAGPAPTSATDLAVRVVSTVVAVAIALVLSRRRLPWWAPVGVGVAAVVAGVL